MTRSFQRAQNHVKTRSVEKVRRRNTEKVRRSKTVLILSHYRIFGPVGKSKIESCLPENRKSKFCAISQMAQNHSPTGVFSTTTANVGKILTE